jgi:hypothetical protein
MRAANEVACDGVILVNPWARTDSGEARAYLKYYYKDRLLSSSFWRKLIRGEFRVLASIMDLFSKVWAVAAGVSEVVPVFGFIEKMRTGMRALNVPVLLLLSEHDLTAKEFIELVNTDSRWDFFLRSDCVTIVRIANADHTFSDRASLDNSSDVCIEWLGEITKAQDLINFCN